MVTFPAERHYYFRTRFLRTILGATIKNQKVEFRSCHQRCSIKKKSCSEEFRDIHKKTPVFESLLHKVACLRACNFIKSDCNTYLPVKFAKILRTSFFTEHLWWLHLWCPVANFTKSSIFDFWLGSQCASLARSFFWNVLNQKSTGSIFQIENHCRWFSVLHPSLIVKKEGKFFLLRLSSKFSK